MGFAIQLSYKGLTDTKNIKVINNKMGRDKEKGPGTDPARWKSGDYC